MLKHMNKNEVAAAMRAGWLFVGDAIVENKMCEYVTIT